MKVFGKTMRTGLIALSIIAFTAPAFAQGAGGAGGGASGGSGGGGDTSSTGGPPGIDKNRPGNTGSVSPTTGQPSGGPGSMQETAPRPQSR